MKKLISIALSYAFVCSCSFATTSASGFLSPSITVPVELVVDAGVNAQSFSNTRSARESYIIGYRRGVLESLIYGEPLKTDSESIYQCSVKSSEDIEISSLCGYLKGIANYFNQTVDVQLSDFGYKEVQVEGVLHQEHRYYALHTKSGDKWQLENPQGLEIKQGESYVFKGMLSPKGSYSNLLLEKQFIVREVN